MKAEMDETQAKPKRALPLAVAGGIAFTVFGVLLGVNGGKDKPTSATDQPAVKPEDKPADKPADKPVAQNDKPADKPAAATTPDAGGAATAQNDKPADKPATPATPDAGGPATAQHDKPADAAPKNATLTFAVKPADARVTLDGKPVSGGKAVVPVADHKVKVAASAPGFQPYEGEVSLAMDATVTIDLKKEVAVAPKPPPQQQPKQPPRPPRPPKHPKVDL